MIKTCEYNDNPVNPLEVLGAPEILVLQKPCPGCRAIEITRDDPRAVTFIGGKVFICMLLADRYPDEQLAASGVIILPEEEVNELRETVERLTAKRKDIEEYESKVNKSIQETMRRHENRL